MALLMRFGVCYLLWFLLLFRPSLAETYEVEQAYLSGTVTLALVLGGLVFLGALIKWYCHGGVCRSKARLDGKTAIVTGANTGIGKETALDFAQRGAKVILACRNEEKALAAAKEIITQTKSNKVVVRILDLSSFESVRDFAKHINESEDRLDILVNNAGFANGYKLTKDGYESIFQVNYLSHFLLTLLLVQKLKQSTPSRIVSVSSMLHTADIAKLELDDFKLSKGKFDATCRYAQSKLAQVMFTRELSRHLEGTGVTVNSLHPGAVSTDIWRHWKLLEKPYIKPLWLFINFLFFKNCREGAQTTIYCSVAEELAGVSGLYFSDCQVKECGKLAQDSGVAKKLWEVSESLTGECWKEIN